MSAAQRELALWHLDQEINLGGFLADVPLAQAAVRNLKIEKAALDARAYKLTGGAVTAATQRDKLLLYLVGEAGMLISDLQADTLEAALDDDLLDEPTKELIRVRLLSSMASTSKYTRLLNCVGTDGRMRGTLQFCGASRTGRWSGRTYQPQNLPRVPDWWTPELQEQAAGCVMRDDVAALETLGLGLRETCSYLLRGLMIAPPGKKLVAADYSSIEARVLAWLLGEQWVLDAFIRGDDIYKLMYSRAFNVPVEQVTKAQRQIGKGMVLSLWYGGGVGAFISVAASYGLDIEELARIVPTIAQLEHMAAARREWAWATKMRKTMGLPEDQYVACSAVKNAARDGVPSITKGWAAYEFAAKAAVEQPGTSWDAGRCTFERRGNWLTVWLPSGRCLMYPSPRIDERGTLSYMGSVNKQWRRIKTYGGKLAENVTQAVARDVLAAALPRVDELGLKIVMHVHDEIVAETWAEYDDALPALIEAMTVIEPWMKGLPIEADGFEGPRYAKH